MTPTEEAVLAANRTFYEAFARHDVAAMARVWAREHPVACVHPGWDALHGREAVLASLRAILSPSDAPQIRASDEAVLLFGHLAIVTCTEYVGGGELSATNVFALEEGIWKMVHHHASPKARSRLPPAGPSSSLN